MNDVEKYRNIAAKGKFTQGFLKAEVRTSFGLILICITILLIIGLLRPIYAQEQSSTKHPNSRQSAHKRGFFNLAQSAISGNITPQGVGSAVKGIGTAGMIPKWLDSSTIGDSVMTEAAGNIGISAANPGSKLTVAGMIEATLGGYKFPDGTLQSTAAVSGITSVVHDSTLNGAGIGGSPLGLKIPLTIDGTAGTFPVFSVRGRSDDAPGVMTVIDEAPPGPDTTGIALAVLSRNWIGIQAVGQSVGVEAVALSRDIASVGVYARGGFFGIDASCTTANCSAVHGYVLNGGAPGYAGQFAGNVNITGVLTKGGGSFRIDHPLDPENKYLSHSFVESPDMMNIYNGNVTLDSNGEAVVDLPEWYGALNRDARYLLTAIGAPGPSLYIAQKIVNNRFKIAGGQPGMEVSWQVTGIRQDAWANKNRIPVEEQKSDIERGHYLHPELFNLPEEKSIEWVRNPEFTRRVKQQRERMKQQR